MEESLLAKGIAPARYSRSRVVLFFSKVCQIGRRRVIEALVFFKTLFSTIRGCRAPFTSGQATEDHARHGGQGCTTGAIRSCPLPFRTHNAPRVAQGKFSGRRENRCFVRLYRRTRETESYVRIRRYVRYRTGRIGRGSKKHSPARFPAPDNTVNVNSMSYGDARKMEEHAVKMLRGADSSSLNINV